MAHAEAGSIALALAIFALWKSRARERWFFAILGLICLMASAEAWPVAQFLHRLPLLNLAMNDRLASAVPLCLGILAAFAIDALSDRAGIVMAGLLDPPRRRRLGDASRIDRYAALRRRAGAAGDRAQ